MRMSFKFPRREYDKYDVLGTVDQQLDIKAALRVSNDLEKSLNYIYDSCDGIVLHEANGEAYEILNSTYHGYHKALMAHLALQYWAPLVKTIPIDRTIAASPGMSELMNMSVSRQIMSVRSVRVNIWLPRFVDGIFKLPISWLGLFSLSFAFEYTAIRWITDNNLGFRAVNESMLLRAEQQRNVILATLQRARQIIERGE